jgi:hypothetical protein
MASEGGLAALLTRFGWYACPWAMSTAGLAGIGGLGRMCAE